MSNIKKIEELLNQEVLVLESKIAKVKNALKELSDNEEIEVIEQEQVIPVEPVMANNVTVERDEDLRILFGGYPVEGKQRDKVRLILDRYNRAISEPEFERVIRLMEGEQAKGTLDVFQRTLRGMTHPKLGEILQFNIEGHRTRFYAKPDWRNPERTGLLRDKLPIPNQLNNLDERALLNPVYRFKRVD